jgi:alcohol dehydrogenase class IV
MEILAERWEQLLKRIGCRTRLSEFDITATMDLQEIVNAVNQDRLANNPRRINDRELTQLVASFA